MPMHCCVYECHATSENNPELSFFQIPSEKKLRKSWEDRIRREDWEPSKFTRVCSRHFLPSDIRPPNPNRPVQYRIRKLKPGTLPHLNLRGKANDERVESRTSKTSMKARSVEVNPAGEQSSSSSYDVNLDPQLEAQLAPSTQDDEVKDLQMQVERLRQKLLESKQKEQVLEQEVEVLNGKLFRYVNLNNDQIQAYTNMDKNAFTVLSMYLDRFNPVTYWNGRTVNSISHDDQLLICLMKLKFNLPLYDLADRYSVTRTTITNIYMTYLHLIHEVVFKAILNKIPSVEKNRSCLPDSFGDFSNCRIIIDCTEFTIEKPRSKLNTASLLFSNYKHNLTAKYLIGVAPNGAITYVSDGYMGSISDKMATTWKNLEKPGKMSIL